MKKIFVKNFIFPDSRRCINIFVTGLAVHKADLRNERDFRSHQDLSTTLNESSVFLHVMERDIRLLYIEERD